MVCCEDTGGDGDVRGVGYVVRILGVMVTSEVLAGLRTLEMMVKSEM